VRWSPTSASTPPNGNADSRHWTPRCLPNLPQRAAFEQLRARHFDTPSQRRVASLEAIGALPAPGG